MATTPTPHAAAMDNTIIAKYLNRPVVRQRNQVTLVQWADYIATSAIPSPADDAWVRQRIVAETIPMMLDSVTTQTLTYFLQDGATVSNILQFISEDNDTPTEQSLSTSNQNICGAFMPRYAQATISDTQVQNWRTQNNAPAATKH